MAWGQLRSSYDTVADQYETRFEHELDGKPRDRELLTAFAISVDDPVLDVGCGPGQIGRHVQDRGRRVLGLDLSLQMARKAGHRLSAAAAADMRCLPVARSSCGGVVAFYSLIHVERHELVTVWRELHRVLRPGGKALVAAHEGRDQYEADEFLGTPVPFVATMFELDELVAASTAAGLEIGVAERRPPYATESGTTRLYVEAVKPLR